MMRLSGVKQTVTLQQRFRGILLGTAVGDALGLPAEGISRRRARRMFPGRPRHRFLFANGMISDDTEHTLFVAQSLLAHPTSSTDFARRLAWCLRWWLLSLPAGVGFGTLRSILRLWVGAHPSRSGVRSAGNGPAMRAAPLGGFFPDSALKRNDFVDASTRITHTDPRAIVGARAVAAVAAWAVREELAGRPTPEALTETLRSVGDGEPEWEDLLGVLAESAGSEESVQQFADRLGLQRGVSGYVYHTVGVALYAWFRHFGDYERTIDAVLDCGGDADTTGAIAGALAGAVVGEGGIPEDWVAGMRDWPRTAGLFRRVADALVAEERARPIPYFWPGLVLRNALFLVVVLLHGLRRLLPPY
ncbi:MAG: ADP-ribosylglycohydrolase family protein [Gemmatimonadetes bacterium]|nr:ADP-ribosylglycohydrolase family protein [Gemmatimonadota bacterium]